MEVGEKLSDIFEEFEEQKQRYILEIKEKKEKGIPIIGTYCSYFPMELAIAAGAAPVRLCTHLNSVIQSAENDLPKSICPLVKSSYGMAIEDKCPAFHFSDLIIGETTCVGKKKMYELLAKIKPVFVMEVPNSKSYASTKFWENQIRRTKEYLECFLGITITDEDLKQAIYEKNQLRIALRRLCEVMRQDPAPVLGQDIQKIVTGVKRRFDYLNAAKEINDVVDKILEMDTKESELSSRPRILLTGCPVGGDTLKIIHLIEENGGVVVVMDNCGGAKSYRQMVDENNPNLYEALAEGYLTIDCSIMTLNDQRIELIDELIDEYKVDGVVELILSGCHSAGVESVYIRKFVNEEKKLPYIAVDTDYEIDEHGLISKRIISLIEMISAKKAGGTRIDINQCYKVLFSGLVETESMSVTLEKLYAYTKMPLVILDSKENEIFYVGMKSGKDWKNWENIIEYEIPGNMGRCIANAAKIQMKSKAKELLEIIVRSCLMQKNFFRKPYQDAKKNRPCPDYMWLLIDDRYKKENLIQELEEKSQIVRDIEEKTYAGILLSGISGNKERNEIIDLCTQYAKDNFVSIIVGNGFRDLNKERENRQILVIIFDIKTKKNLRQRIYLIEDYYQEIAISYIQQRVKPENLKIPELELIKSIDQEKDGHLYETLYWYLMLNRNAMQTAVKLKLHRNTLTHRIERINEIVNLDAKDGKECQRLLLAMQLDQQMDIM